jgi:hypothetical protein
VLEIGETIERYQVEAMLGSGGLAAVYRVRHLHLGTVHALKVLLVATPLDRARLLSEGQVQARLKHPNVVAVSDVLVVHRAPALVMELVEGPSLEQQLQTGPLPLEHAMGLLRGIVAGVGAAHAAGLVHRDLKPSNVLLGQGRAGETVAKVTDFGLVRPMGAPGQGTSSGTAVGTPAYMAPEQIREPSAVDTRADLWGLGCLLYELVCGRRAFPMLDPFLLYEAVAAGRYEEPAGVEPRIAGVIRDLLQVDPKSRIPSCAALWERLWDEPPPPELQDRELISLLPPAKLPRGAPTAPGAQGQQYDPRQAVGAGAVAGGTVSLLGLLAWAVLVPLLSPEPPAGRPAELVERAPVPQPAPEAAQPETVPVEAGQHEAGQPRAVEVEALATDSAPPPVRPDPVPAPPPVVPESSAAVAMAAEVEPEVVAAEPAMGRVQVEGDAREVWLEAGGERLSLEGPVPAGSYTVRARWDDGAVRLSGKVEVHAGGITRLRCASFVLACAEIPAL